MKTKYYHIDDEYNTLIFESVDDDNTDPNYVKVKLFEHPLDTDRKFNYQKTWMMRKAEMFISLRDAFECAIDRAIDEEELARKNLFRARNLFTKATNRISDLKSEMNKL